MIVGQAFLALPAQNPQRAGRFYREMLGLRAGEWNVDAWVEVEAPDGATLALEHADRPYLALETDDIFAEVARLQESGVELVQDIRPSKAEVADPDCRAAFIRDSEGNVVMIHQKRPAGGW